jgi:uncharacterized protein
MGILSLVCALHWARCMTNLPSTSVHRRRASCALATLLLATACSELEPQTLPSESDPEQLSESELAEFAESAQVKALNAPFEQSPQPSVSLHVPMSDGVRLALSLYFPTGVDLTHGKAPVLLVEAWYGRAVEATATAIDLYRAAGFVVAISDQRGMGASFGSHTEFVSERVRRDHGELLGWLSAQPWSTGQSATAGLSISATNAEAIASSGAASLQAAIVRASDFDQYANNLFLGGIPNARALGLIETILTWMRGDACVAELASCPDVGLARVDEDERFELLQSALVDHRVNLDGASLRTVVYRDDRVGSAGFEGVNASDHVAELRRAAVPARVSASWLDGSTAQSALARFVALPDVPMELAIGATAHSGGLDADPFSTVPFRAARPGAVAQYAADVDFVKRALSGAPIARKVDYHVLGADQWKTTSVWPPHGVESGVLHLAPAALLSASAGPPAQQSYQVDPSAASGSHFNRWSAQTGAPVFYGDRRAAPGRRLSFDGAPLASDTELVGSPELCVQFRSDQPDGLLIAYLEDVAPDGRVTYLTEGELRLLHRKTDAPGCDPAPGTARSFLRIDGASVTPGELMTVELSLLPVAALLRAGHHLRLSLAGADAGTFPLMTEVPATWSIAYGGTDGSTLRLPTRPWSSN